MEFEETFLKEKKPISGDGFIIEMGGAFLCVACDFVAGQVDTIKNHMNEQHYVELKGNMAKRMTKLKQIKSNVVKKKQLVNKKLKEEDSARFYNTSNAPAPGTFPCGKCKIICYGKASYVKHMYEIHNRKLRLFSCDICGKKFFDKEGLQYHMSNLHTEIQHDPESASIQNQEYFQNQCYLPTVKSIQSNTILAQRPIKTVKNISTYNKMLPNWSNNPFNLPQACISLCSFCDLKFQSSVNLTNHIALNHAQGHIDVNQSTEQFTMNIQTKNSSNFHQENKKSQQTFNTLVSTETHNTQLFYAKSYQVQSEIRVIQTTESCITNKNIHQENQTLGKIKELSTVSKKVKMLPNIGRTQLECNVCGESFGFCQTKYITHMNKIHKSNIKPFLCTLCNYRCLRKARLKGHMKTRHQMIKKF